MLEVIATTMITISVLSIIAGTKEARKQRQQNYDYGQRWARHVLDLMGPYEGKTYLEGKIKEDHVKDFAPGIKSIIKENKNNG